MVAVRALCWRRWWVHGSSIVGASARSHATSESAEIAREESARLHSARHEVVGSRDPSFVSVMVLSELACVVASQQVSIEEQTNTPGGLVV